MASGDGTTQTTSFSHADVKEVWAQACAELELKVSEAAYNTWIEINPLTNLEKKQNDADTLVATITSPTAFHSVNVKKSFATQIKSTLESITDKSIELEFMIGNPVQSADANPTDKPVRRSRTLKQQTGSATEQITTPGSVMGQRPGNPAQQQQSTENNQSAQAAGPISPQQGTSASPRVEDLFSQSTMQASSAQRAKMLSQKAGLTPEFTFETFAVSGSNEMAHAAATAVSQRPGQAYNPLFLYGDVGVGKTHLMHAIGNNILKNDTQKKVIYVTGEEFTNEIVNAIQSKKAIQFKEKFRAADVLLIDDIQFIAGKNTVQEEFFHTFNALVKQSRQIVLTSDRPPHEIRLLEDRLQSRVEAGLMFDIQQPSFELRTAILMIKSQAKGLNLPMDIAQHIASNVESARKIEGIITKIQSSVELQKRPLSMKMVKEILENEAPQEPKKLKVKPTEVIRAVANHYHIKQTQIRGKRRTKDVVKARHVAMYLLIKDLDMALAETGRWFSNRDHTSAMHARDKIADLLDTDKSIQQDVSAIRMSLSAISR